jgi:hypothetical protein
MGSRMSRRVLHVALTQCAVEVPSQRQSLIHTSTIFLESYFEVCMTLKPRAAQFSRTIGVHPLALRKVLQAQQICVNEARA